MLQLMKYSLLCNRNVKHFFSHQFHHYSTSVGIIGVPNIGKSLLFNVLTNTTIAKTENYSFCTIDPNVANAPLYDPILNQLGQLEQSLKIIPPCIELRDIAGLVRGASTGSVSTLLHVIRCFPHPEIVQFEPMTPVQELEIITNELILSDIALLNKKYSVLIKSEKTADIKRQISVVEKLLDCLNKGFPGRVCIKPEDSVISQLHTLTTKPTILICNTSPEDIIEGGQSCLEIKNKATQYGLLKILHISALFEHEIMDISQKDPQFIQSYLNDIGLTERLAPKILDACLDSLGLTYFYTVGPEETKAWIYRQGACVSEASSVIHSSFRQKVTSAYICTPDIMLQYGKWEVIQKKGLYQICGRHQQLTEKCVVYFQLK